MVAPALDVEQAIGGGTSDLVRRRSQGHAACNRGSCRGRLSSRGGAEDDRACLLRRDGRGCNNGATSATPGKGTETLGLGIDESKSRSGNELESIAVADVVDEGLVVRGDEDRDGAVDIGHDTLVEGQGDRGRGTTEEHLAEEALARG